MKKGIGLFLFVAAIFGCITFNPNAIIVNAGSNDYSQPARDYSSVNNDVEAFYTSTEAGSVSGLKGDALLEQLAKVLEVNHKYYNTYGELRGGLAYSDEDPTNTSNIYYFYSGVSVSNLWSGGNVYNREHVWPKNDSSSLFKKVENSDRGAGSDIHHLRPEDAGVNSTRSDHPFADLNKTGTEITYNGLKTGNYLSGSKFEPRDGIKGDVARILMYMYTHYSSEVTENADRTSLSDTPEQSKTGALDIRNVVYTSTGTATAAWDLLLSWNEFDPVDKFEMNRNDYCTSVTGVRNPFIDHPEFATMIWDSSYSGTGALLDTSFDKEIFYLDLQSTSTSIDKGSTYQIVAETNITNPTYSYTSSNTSIASVSSTGLISGVNAGTAYITVACGSLSSIFTVTVNETDIDTTLYDTYQLISNVSDLNAEDKVILVGKNSSNYYALSTNQKSNNRGAVAINVSGTTATINADVAELTLKNGTVSNTFGFYDGTNYLYAASSGNNYLKSKSTLDANGSFLISSATTDTFNVIAQGSYTRNELRFNYNGGDPLFSCYASNTSATKVSIYKKVESNSFDHQLNPLVAEVKATCTTNGTKAHYTCSDCDKLFIKEGDSYVEVSASDLVISASHSYGDLVAAKDAKCEQTGNKAYYYCNVCETYFDSNKVATTLEALTIQATGHTEEIDTAVEPTCVLTGLTEGKHCFVCNQALVAQQVIPATGHSGGSATCKNKAICEECQQPYGELAEHQYGDLVTGTATSCDDTGILSHYKCSVCEKYFNESKVESTLESLTVTAKGHTYGVLIEEYDSNCEEVGMKTHYYCVPCNTYFNENKEVVALESLIIPAKGHIEVKDAAVEPSCEATGLTEGKHCSVCEKPLVVQEVIPSKGHSYGSEIKEVKQDCENDGVKSHYKCEGCGKYFVYSAGYYTEVTLESITSPKLSHNYHSVDEIKATCEDNGVLAYYQCNRCDTLFINENSIYVKVEETQLVILAKGHDYTLVNQVSPTCIGSGVKEHYKCEKCGKTFILESNVYVQVSKENLLLNNTEHSYGNEIAAVPATCETSGNVGYYKCSECNNLFIKSAGTYLKVTIEEVTLNPFNHLYSKINEKTPTCIQTGVMEHYTCSRCNKVYILENGQYVLTDLSSLTLNVVSHNYDNACDTTCNTCNELREVADHIDEDKDNVCEECGKVLNKVYISTHTIIIFSVVGALSLFALFWFIIKKKV